MDKSNRITFLNTLSTVLLMGISFFTAPIFTRLLGDSGYGMLQICTIWASVFAIVFPLQTQSTLASARVKYPEGELNRYQSSAMGLSLLAFLSCTAGVLIFRGPISGLLGLEPRLLDLVLVQAFGTFCVNYLNTKFVYEKRAGWNLLISLAVSLTALALSVILILRLPMELRYVGRVQGIAITYGLMGTAACLYVLAKGRRLFDRKYWKYCLLLGVPSVFYCLSDLVLGQCDQVMIQHMLSVAEVGHYGSAWRFGNIMFVIFEALNRTWCAFFFDEFRNQREKVLVRTRNFLELYTVLAAGFLLLCREVYHIYVGPEFWAGTAVVPIFVLSYYLNFLCNFSVNYEYFRQQTKVVAAVTTAACVLNLGLNYVFIRAFGMIGAALATAISHAVQLLSHYIYTRFLLGKGDYPFDTKLWGKYTLAFAAVFVFAYLTKDLPILRWVLGAAIGVWEFARIKKRKILI